MTTLHKAINEIIGILPVKIQDHAHRYFPVRQGC